MSPEPDGSDMRAEYDIRGGVRGKYYERYIGCRVRVVQSAIVESGLVQFASTASLGRHPAESTVRFVADPIQPPASPVTQ